MHTDKHDNLVLCDVDGVICPVSLLDVPYTDYNDIMTKDEFKYNRHFSPTLMQSVYEWNAQLVWLTTWRSWARKIEAAHNWDTHPILDEFEEFDFKAEYLNRTDPDQPRSGHWWKALALEDYLANHPPVKKLVWIDDDHDHFVHGRDFLSIQDNVEDFRIVCTDQYLGLTPSLVEAIDDYLA